MKTTRDENNSSTSVTAFAHPFSRRNEMTPKGFSDQCVDIREAVLAGHISVGQAVAALKSLQLQLNLAVTQLAYQKMDHNKELLFRMSLLDGQAEQAATNES
jgi:hypothetical protein